jgi:hypothetical protein
MLRNTARAISFITLLTAFLCGCKKDEDTLAPIVNIISPYDNQSFEVSDTMAISAKVSDDVQLTAISVALVNENLVPVLPAISVQPQGKETEFTQPYWISDIHLLSGAYYVKVTASDGKNETNTYRKISLTASPRERKGFYLLSRNTGSTSVYFMDEAFSIAPKLTLSGDYSSSAINSYYQDLYTAGNYTGAINGIDLEAHSVKWSVMGVAGSAPDFVNVYNDGSYTYVSNYNGTIKGYDHNGIAKYTSTLSQNLYPVKVFRHADYIIAEERDITSPARNIVLYYASNGLGFQQTFLSQDIVEFYTKDADNIFMFGNNNGQGVMEIYSISSNGAWQPHAMPAAKLLSAAQVDSNTYLLGFDNNTVYIYTYFNNSLLTWLTNVKATDMIYDDVRSEVIIAEDMKVSSYSYPSAGLINTAMHTDTIVDMHVLYDK